jgi:tetratricopeptide (TPR) repeat protein
MMDVNRKCGLVYLTNSTNGLSIVKEIAAAIPGSHPGVELLPYERYNARAALARRELARALRSGGVDSALALYRTIKGQSVARAPESLLNDLGYSLLNVGSVAQSIVVFEENARQFPSSGNVYDSLGDAYLTARKPIEARKAFEHACSLDPRDSRARHLADSLGGIR